MTTTTRRSETEGNRGAEFTPTSAPGLPDEDVEQEFHDTLKRMLSPKKD